ESNPVVSPDGKQIAFVDTSRVFVAQMTGGAPVQVATGGAPAWAPSGSGLIYQSTTTSLNAGGNPVVAIEDLLPFPVRLLPNNRFLYTADGKIRIRNLDGTN